MKGFCEYLTFQLVSEETVGMDLDRKGRNLEAF